MTYVQDVVDVFVKYNNVLFYSFFSTLNKKYYNTAQQYREKDYI